MTMGNAMDAVLVHTSTLEPLAQQAERRWPTFRLWADAGSGGLTPEEANRVRVFITQGNLPVDGAFMDRFPRLSLIAGIAAGHEGIDKAAAAARGIAVTNAALDDNSDMADWALGAIIVLLRGMLDGDRFVRDGRWQAGYPPPGRRLSSRKVGIVGLGGIGQAIAERCAALNIGIGWWGPRPKDVPYPRAASVIALARESDMLVLACPLSEETRHLVDAEVIDAVGPAGFIVNIARGGVIDETALIAALREGRLGGAALDVFDPEPTDPERWADVPNILLSPHRAGHTRERFESMLGRCLENVVAGMEGGALVCRVA